MDDLMFKASGLAALDPLLVDAQVVAVLTALTGTPWERIAHTHLTAPVSAARVDVSGTAQDSVLVRMSNQTVQWLSGMLAPGEPIPALETACEIANLLAGHLKAMLADGMATGLPVPYPDDPGPLAGYRSVFSSGSNTLEVSAHG